MKKLLIIICLFISGCTNHKKTEMNISKDDILEKLLSENNYVIVDVRTKEEYDQGHVVDALNIPYDQIDENVALDKNKTIIVYCRSGNRSGIAFQTLTDLGYEVFDLGAYDSIKLDKE